MSIVAWFGSVVCALGTAPQTAGEHLLARVPTGLELTTDVVLRNNRNAFDRRSSIAWSADGRAVAYAATREGEYFPVVGEDVGEAFGFVARPVLAGGHAFFHVVRTKNETQERHWLWVDGRKIGPEDWMGDLVVRADGKQVAFWTRSGAKFGGAAESASAKDVLVVASNAASQWSLSRGNEWNEAGTVRFSADGKRVVAAACDRKGWVLMQAGKKETRLCEPCASIESFGLSASGAALALVRTQPPRASDSAFLEESDGPELLFRDRRIGRKHDVVASATVDPRGEHVAYVVTHDKQRTVAIDEEAAPRGSHGFVLELVFDATGQRLAYVAVDGGLESRELPGRIQGGQWYVVVRDGPAEPRELPHFLEVRDLVWDASGARLAYAAREEAGWLVVCGETRSAAHDDVGPPVFSADGRRLGFGSRDGRELWWRELALQ